MTLKHKNHRPITNGSRGVSYRTRGGTAGTGTVVLVYGTKTGNWYVIKDATTGETHRCRGAQVWR